MKWNNVKDELPKSGKPVLVAVYRYGKFKRICLGVFLGDAVGWHDYEAWERSDYRTSFNHLTGEVTYWQHLPNAPAETDCLSCNNSYSLPAGEKFDDGSVEDFDRLVCLEGDQPLLIMSEGKYCEKHTQRALSL